VLLSTIKYAAILHLGAIRKKGKDSLAESVIMGQGEMVSNQKMRDLAWI